MNFFKSLRFRVIFMFVIIITPMVFVLIHNNYYSMGIVRNQVAQSYNNILPVYVDKVDESLDEIHNYLIRMTQDQDVAMFGASSQADADDMFFTTRNVSRQLSRDLNFYGSVDSFFIFSPYNEKLIVTSVTSENRDLKYQRIKSYLGRIINIQPWENQLRWNLIELDGVYMLIKVVYDKAGVYLGACAYINNIISANNIRGMPDGGLLVMSGDGIPLSSNSLPASFVNEACSELKKQGSAYEGIIMDPGDHKRYLTVACKSNRVDLLCAVAVDEQQMLEKFAFFRLMLYLLPLVAVLVLLIYYVTISGVLLRPISELIKGMRKISEGNFNINLKYKGASEFKSLIDVFNNMVQQIKNLKINVYEEQLKVQNAELETHKAELRHLQVQINPHFYANSLNVVYSLAALKDYKAIQKMALYLVNYFRYIIGNGNNMIRLSGEITHIVNYLEIQKYRFTNKLTYAVDIPEDYLAYRIPHLTIQPFVENSIVHGFQDRDEPLGIQIFAEPCSEEPDKYYEICVKDNGVGFPEEKLMKWSNSVHLKDTGERHIGIWNVYHRLGMYFGSQAGITFRNDEKGGAVVRIRFPKLMDGEACGHV